MTGQIAHHWRAGIHHHIADCNSLWLSVQLGCEHGMKVALRGGSNEYSVFAAVRPTVGCPGGLGVGQILGEQFGPGALRCHTGSANRQCRKKTHPVFPSSMAARSVFRRDFRRLVAIPKRMSFSASRRLSLSMFTLLPSFLVLRPLTSAI